MEDAKLMAPFNGMVNRVNIREGARLYLGKTVMVLVDPSELEIEAVGEEKIPKLVMERVVLLDILK